MNKVLPKIGRTSISTGESHFIIFITTQSLWRKALNLILRVGILDVTHVAISVKSCHASYSDPTKESGKSFKRHFHECQHGFFDFPRNSNFDLIWCFWLSNDTWHVLLHFWYQNCPDPMNYYTWKSNFTVIQKLVNLFTAQ